MNLAAAWKLPLCFFIENNRYAVSTTVDEATGEPRLSGRGPGFGIASWKVDGMDPVAVHLAMQEAVEHMRAGNGPAVVEADVYRYFHQNGGFPGSAFGYRTKEEEQEWRARDPIDQVALNLTRRGIVDRASRGRVQPGEGRGGRPRRGSARAAARWQARTTPNQARRVARPRYVDVGVRSDLSELADAPSPTRHVHRPGADTKFIDAVAGVMRVGWRPTSAS